MVEKIDKTQCKASFNVGKKTRFGSARADEIHRKAYEVAEQNRIFQIESHLKRAHYFWLFQATAYAGYFYSITAENNELLRRNPAIYGYTLWANKNGRK